MPPSLKILVVEDNPLDTEMMLREIRRAGIEPDWLRVDNEKDYLSHLQAGLDLIISDFRMPQFGGLRALEILKETGFDIPFILVSGTIGEDVAVKAMKQGATDYLLKDRLTRLGSAVQHALDETRLRRERKAARETLRLRDKALNAVSQGVLIADENRLIIYANESFKKLTGYEESEILGHGCAILQGPDTDPATVQKIRAALDAKTAFEGTILNYRKDGRVFWNDLSIAPFLGQQGEPLRFIGVLRDVTARKHAEEHLAANESLLRQFIQHTPAAIAMLDTQMRYIQTSERWMQDYHLEGRDIIGKSHYEIFPDMPPHWKKIHQRVLAGGVDRCDEAAFPRADGSMEWLQWEVRPWHKAGGEIGGLLMFTQLITDRKRAEMEVRFNEQRYRSLVEGITAIVWDTPASGEFETEQPRWSAFTGQTFAELRGHGWLQAIHPEDQAKTASAWAAAVAGRFGYEVEHRLRAADQTYHHMRVRAVPILAEDGTIRQWIGIHTDITEERLREEKLAAALVHERELSEQARAGDRAKGEFLAVMSHEIRTPLNGILGFSDLLARTPHLPAESLDYAKTITSSGQALLRILNDVLDYSRLESGNMTIEMTEFNPREVLGDIHSLLSQQARDKDLVLRISIDEAIPANLTGDAGRLRQILLNLASNAIKFTDSGWVVVGLRRPIPEGTDYEFFVKDTGCGITVEQSEHLFQPFTQADSSTSRRHGGSGLGLSISRRLAVLLGGTLTVRSEPDQGAEFVLAVKLDEAEAVTAGVESIPPQALDSTFAARHPLRILIVEDDNVNLKLMLNLVRRLGYEPIFAKNGGDAVEKRKSQAPDCILMDLQMPEMDGIEATETIRAWETHSRPDNPVFITALTANIIPADRQRCFDAGMNHYLNKPVKLAALGAVLMTAENFVAIHH